MTPEDRIQAAWVQRAKRDLEAKRSQGLAARQTSWPVWAPEVAVQALRDAGWTPPNCNCSPDPGREDGMRWEASICGAARPLTKRDWEILKAAEESLFGLDTARGVIDQAMRDIADEGEWPEVGA